MPNWCANRLTVSGPQADLDAFRAKAKCPPTCDAEVHKGGTDLCPLQFGWTEATGEGWTFPMRSERDPNDTEEDGTHTAIRATAFQQEGGEDGNLDATTPALLYEFISRWGPPEAWLKQASAEFPSLAFVIEYAEPLGDFAGRLRYEVGSETEEMKGQARDNEDLAAEAPFFY